MADFDIEFEKVVVAEGGYVNNPNDNGEETYLGISRKHNPDWDAWREIDNIKRVFGTKGINKRLKNNTTITNSAKRIYRYRYWNKLELDDVPNQNIAHQLFDTAVNCGLDTAIRLAQRVLGMTPTGKWSEALKYNLMKYEARN